MKVLVAGIVTLVALLGTARTVEAQGGQPSRLYKFSDTTLTVLEDVTYALLASVDVGFQIRHVAIAPGGNLAYVIANGGPGRLARVDLGTGLSTILSLPPHTDNI